MQILGTQLEMNDPILSLETLLSIVALTLTMALFMLARFTLALYHT